jgi:hypothetical protein
MTGPVGSPRADDGGDYGAAGSPSRAGTGRGHGPPPLNCQRRATRWCCAPGWCRGPPRGCYGVMVVANASVRLLVLPLLVWMKTDLNAVRLFARPM